VPRFSKFVQVGGPDACWKWIGHAPKGIPVFSLAGRRVQAARVAFCLAYRRTIPTGWRVYHTCKSALCQNPKHMRLKKPAPPPAPTPAPRGRSKLSPADVAFAREAVAAGMGNKFVAERLGMSESGISRAIRREQREEACA